MLLIVSGGTPVAHAAIVVGQTVYGMDTALVCNRASKTKFNLAGMNSLWKQNNSNSKSKIANAILGTYVVVHLDGFAVIMITDVVAVHSFRVRHKLLIRNLHFFE